MPDGTSFSRRVAIAVGIAVAIVAAAAFVWNALHVLLLIFAAVLVAVLLRSAGGLVARVTRLGEHAALAIAVVLIAGLLITLFVVAGHEIAKQVDDLVATLPGTVERARARLAESPAGRALLSAIPERWTAPAGWFSSTFGALGNVLVVSILGVYFAFDARRHTTALVGLLPHPRRARATEVVEEMGRSLRGWMKGQLVAMVFIGVSVTITLFALGIPLALVLGILAGALNFVPYLGPLIALVPALFFAIAEDPIKALWLVAIYVTIQNVEAYLVVPLIQRRLVHLAPSLILISELLLGLWAGVLGIVVATPLAVVVTVLVRKLWIEDALGDTVPQRD